jgi:hypothetical protein
MEIRRLAIAILAWTIVSAGCGGVSGLLRPYEYEEEMYLSLDGSATVYVNSSVAALNALRGTSFDPGLSGRGDLDAVRDYFASPVTRVRPVRTSRRDGRRFVHLRIDVDQVDHLSETAPFAWSTYRLERDGDQVLYRQLVEAPAGYNVKELLREAGLTGDELVAFRVHAPSKVEYHNAGAENLKRGNILVWEQSIADRLRGTTLLLDARMQRESILYRTLLLFGGTVAGAASLFAAAIWWVRRRGLAQIKA